MSRTPSNVLLNSLAPATRSHLLSLGKSLDLPVRTRLYNTGETPAYGYFIYSGVASIVVGLEEGGSAEVGLIGPEGLVGSFHLLGPATSNAECFIQIPASGLRVPFPALKRLFNESEEFRNCVLEYIQRQSVILSQIAACNKLHEAEARLARWLLMVQDRIGGDTLQLTQEFIAQMLGTRRTTVAVVAGTLQNAGLIEYKRGRVQIQDRRRVEEAACDCYKIVRDVLSPAP